MKIPILAQTYQAYIDSFLSLVGKGSRHAGLAYSEWYRTGVIQGKDLSFQHAEDILQAILDLTNITLPEVAKVYSDDKTTKFLLRTQDNLEIESVLIPMQAGGTLCISSQVGCRMGCTFCETGRMGLLRNLTTEEIVSQVFIARFRLGLQVRNIVFMGMGEPLDNYEHVIQSVKVLTDPHGLGFGIRQLTISTSGKIQGIYQLLNEKGFIPNLAVSVNAPSDEMRNRLMPVNRKHDMQALYEAMRAFCEQTNREILAAYVLIHGENDTIEHADQLARYLKGLPVKINLIPYNPQSHDRYQAPSDESIDAFNARLRDHGYFTLLRQTKGQPIMAACGQLGNLALRARLRKERSGVTSHENENTNLPHRHRGTEKTN
jgi:23S rRNA (adenine2503-C2)-methyltransferase